jgi:hypothetical protein
MGEQAQAQAQVQAPQKKTKRVYGGFAMGRFIIGGH